MKLCKEIDPSIKTGLLYSNPIIDAADYCKRAGIDALHPRFSCLEYSPELVKEAHNRGLKVNTWTANTEKDIQFCIGLGVDSIISNFPDLLHSLLGT
jgi:glycerophosphoryl diester phosphodiesterase